MLHNELLWITPTLKNLNYTIYNQKYYITKELEKELSEYVNFIHILHNNKLHNELKKFIKYKLINENKIDDLNNLLYYFFDKEYQIEDLTMIDSKFSNSIKNDINNFYNEYKKIYEIYEIMYNNTYETSNDNIKETINQLLNYNKEKHPDISVSELSLTDTKKITNFLINKKLFLFDELFMNNINDSLYIEDDSYYQLYSKLDIYYNHSSLLDQYHFGFKSYKKFIDNIIQNLTNNYKCNGIKTFYIISDSTIDYSYIYNLFKEKYNHDLCKYIVEQRENYLKDKLKSITDLETIIYIDAIGGTGYITEFEQTNFNLKKFIKNYIIYKNLYDDTNNELTNQSCIKLFNLINKMINDEIIKINDTQNKNDIYLIRIIKYFFINKINFSNILCFGYGNDIDWSIDVNDNNFVKFNIINLMMKIFWRLSYHIIYNFININNYIIDDNGLIIPIV